MKYLLIAMAFAPAFAHGEGIVERRIWIETAVKPLQESLCAPEAKTWHCAFPDRILCEKTLKEIFTATCSANLVPDLPEYIDGPGTKAQANKVIIDCLNVELAKRFILPLSHEKMNDYNVCTGVTARTKPLNPLLQKSLDFSKSQTTTTCAAGGFMRKCFSLSQASCDDALNQHQLDCTMKMEKDGVAPKDEASAQDVGRKVTDCALQGMRTALSATHKPLKDKDCE